MKLYIYEVKNLQERKSVERNPERSSLGIAAHAAAAAAGVATHVHHTAATLKFKLAPPCTALKLAPEQKHSFWIKLKIGLSFDKSVVSKGSGEGGKGVSGCSNTQVPAWPNG